MASTPDKIEVKVEIKNMPETAARILRAKIFPEFKFVVRGEGPGKCWVDFYPNGGNKAEFTRPATPEEWEMYQAFQSVGSNLVNLLTVKATEHQTAVDRLGDYDELLRSALQYAPELATVPNPERLMKLRELRTMNGQSSASVEVQ